MDACRPARLVGEREPPRMEWSDGYAVRTASNGGSELVIFVPRAADSHEYRQRAVTRGAARRLQRE